MPARDDDFARLAKRLGVASHYFDQGDARIEISRDTQAALMEALGFPASTPAQRQESLQRLDAARGALLPPWLVLDAGAAQTLELAQAIKPTCWTISGDNGFHLEQRTQGHLELPALEPGYYHLDSESLRVRSLLIVAPPACWTPPALAPVDARAWGLSAQVYGLRSQRNFGFGDFTDVANLAKAAGRHGAAFLGLSPLHALFSSDRSKISPYSPSSRLFMDPLYLDPDVIGATPQMEALRPRLARLRMTPLVDYREAWDVKRTLLEALFVLYQSNPPSRSLLQRTQDLGEALQSHATFEALSERFTAQGQNWAGAWPEEFFDAASPAVVRFRRDHPERVAFHVWLQALCDEQLERAAQANGMEIGLYRDLAVGADRFGSEVWAAPDRYALTLSVGAPPDPLGPQGQNWGFPPFNPITLEMQDFAAFRDLVVANMRHAGAIRIDHAFQLQRLFVVPPGATAEHGGYIAFPFEALLAILRIESQRHRCMVIAEDLGTGPQGFSDAIMRSGLLSYRILSFERTKNGGFVAPGDYPRAALAAITTHDLPTFKGWRRGLDIDIRSYFGVYSAAQARREHHARREDVAQWQAALRTEGFSGALSPDAVSRNEALSYLARTPSMLLAVQIEDLCDEINQANLPGLSEGPPNWRRRMSETIEDLATDNGPLGKAGALMMMQQRTLRKREAQLAAAPPRATYRLQFHAGFTFEMAREILPYLRKLGISHIYTSPIQQARKGSTHGYDIVDPRAINPELGGRDAFDKFVDGAHAHGLKIIVDIVPNHMGIGGENPFWSSVLKWGERSPYAHVFDIDFQRGGGKVLLPVLGKSYGETLEEGEFKLEFNLPRGFEIRYSTHAFPIAPRACLRLLKHADAAASAKPETYDAELNQLIQTIAPDEIEALCATITADHDAMDKLLREQHYRLAHWRLASSELNYRRFFEINSLAGVRTEDEHVFALMHELIFELIDKSQIDGLRIDHIDGLANPETYLERLQQRVGPGFYIIVEKILARGEKLKPWPIAGSTGYDVLNELDGILVAREAATPLAAFYRDHVGETQTYADALNEAKLLVLERSFGAECDRITEHLYLLARHRRRAQDVSRASLARVLKLAVVALPVYRTYVGAQGADAADRELIATTMMRVRRKVDPADFIAVSFLESILVEGFHEDGVDDLRCAFEQLTGPVMAKGLEDTLFYRHAPFLVLNEVGADPSCFGFTLAAFHEAARVRARDWSASLIATATHDTKRGEDARARLLAMSAAPETFCEAAQEFLAHAEGPDRNDAYILFQALVAAWPVGGAHPASDFRERARAFFQKAMREGKRHSSWTDPNEAYEHKALRLIDKCLEAGDLCDSMRKLTLHFAWPGALNGLARTILKLTLPGVPDFYQGTELWDFAFVDPDNRRPVDFTLRARMLEDISSRAPQVLLADWQDGRIKQWLIARLLAERAADPDLFAYGDYTPRDCKTGLSFERHYHDRALFVCVPSGTQMLHRGLFEAPGTLCAKTLWGSEAVALSTGRWRNLLTGSAFAVEGAMACVNVAGGLPWLILGKIA